MEAKTPAEVRGWIGETLAQLEFEAKALGALQRDSSILPPNRLDPSQAPTTPPKAVCMNSSGRSPTV
jgi:hypothetical protein